MTNETIRLENLVHLIMSQKDSVVICAERGSGKTSFLKYLI